MSSERRSIGGSYEGIARSLPEQLADASDQVYRAALGRLATNPRTTDRGGADQGVLEIVRLLATAPGLSERARADRLRNVLRRLPPRPEHVDRLVALAPECSPGIRVTLAEFLPPSARPALNRLEGGVVTVAAATGEVVRATVDPTAGPGPRPEDAVAAGEPRQGLGTGDERATVAQHHATREAVDFAADEGARRSGGGTGERGAGRRRDGLGDRSQGPRPFGGVAILSRVQHQEGTKRLLQAAGYEPLLWDTVEKLRAELATNADLCACIVDGSVLGELDAAAQRELFQLLGRYSSFLWIRVHEEGLHLSRPDVRGIVRVARCAREEPSNLAFAAAADVTESELQEVHTSNEALCAYGTTSIVPGELDGDRTQLLVAAARQYAQSRSREQGVRIQVVETTMMGGGRSGALIARIRVDGDGEHVVAKIDSKEAIIQEAERFATFVLRWDGTLRPETFLHGRAGVILFALVGAEDHLGRPADTLESRLDALWIAEVHPHGDATPLVTRRDELARGVERACQALGRMNRRSPPNSDFAPYGDPYVGPLERFAGDGVTWGLSEQGTPAAEARRRAQARLARLAGRSVVHGDLHLRNILIRDERDAHLIDYASCGPGHPCVDLARLEVALFTQRVRQLTSEAVCQDYQQRLTLSNASREELAAAFPALHACAVNHVALAGCAFARQESVAVAASFGGDQADYVAAKYLVASQALLTGGSTAMARAIIEALTPEILSWPAAGAEPGVPAADNDAARRPSPRCPA